MYPLCRSSAWVLHEPPPAICGISVSSLQSDWDQNLNCCLEMEQDTQKVGTSLD